MTTSPTPQFATAEYAGSGDSCKSCSQPISGSYYRVNGALTCETCSRELQNQIPKDTHAAFVRALLFGSVAAVIGLIAYAAFGIITGIEIGYVALAVGWLIGKAMRTGSKGIGGRRYQIAAAAFTYAAVSIAAVPMYIAQVHKEKSTRPAQVQTAPSSPGDISSQAPTGNAGGSSVANNSSTTSKPHVNFFAAIGVLALLGLASPFLELQNPVSGLIGLVILFVGMRFAWRQTGSPKIEIIGPFQANTPTAT